MSEQPSPSLNDNTPEDPNQSTPPPMPPVPETFTPAPSYQGRIEDPDIAQIEELVLDSPTFALRARERIKQAGQRGESVAVVYIDLDRLKFVNDIFGHAIGNKLIRTIASSMRLVPPSPEYADRRKSAELDIFGRIGGDELSAIINCGDEEDLGKIEQRIRDNFNKRLDNFEDEKERRIGTMLRLLGVGVSIGRATSEPGSDFDSLTSQAEKLMYAEKIGKKPVDPELVVTVRELCQKQAEASGRDPFKVLVELRDAIDILLAEATQTLREKET